MAWATTTSAQWLAATTAGTPTPSSASTRRPTTATPSYWFRVDWPRCCPTWRGWRCWPGWESADTDERTAIRDPPLGSADTVKDALAAGAAIFLIYTLASGTFDNFNHTAMNLIFYAAIGSIWGATEPRPKTLAATVGAVEPAG